ncbi:MAG: hypothetical protein JO359_04760 [Candidatus Eremiobacteraeota bacterium]|nr:hypothetical protein [Candidatus Eremiobacteraeota bacterium]
MKADPPQPAAAGFLLPAGTPVAIVLDERLDSAQTPPGAVVPGHLRTAIVLRGRTLARAGTTVLVTVTETRRASRDVDGEVVLRLHPVKLSDELELPLRLVHSDLSPPLVRANPEDITLPPRAQLAAGTAGVELVLPAGTVLRAHTAATIDATDPAHTVLVTPPPFTISTDKPYSAFTPIPLFTYNGTFTPPPRRGRSVATPSPSPTPTETATPSPSPTPS